MTFATMRGPLKMRPLDNTFNAPSYLGVAKMTDTYSFPIMVDVNVIPGDVTLPSEEKVMALRKAAKE